MVKINPFLSKGYLTTLASINKTPIYNYSKNEFSNLIASDIFSSKLLNEKIIFLINNKYNKKFNSNNEYYDFFINILNKDNDALDIINEFSESLVKILISLKYGVSSKNNYRKDWNYKHWNFWNSKIKKIILAGGICQGIIGKIIFDNINKYFKKYKLFPYKIEISDFGDLLPLIGVARSNSNNKKTLIFDFGHTYVKRGIPFYKNNILSSIKILDKVPIYTDPSNFSLKKDFSVYLKNQMQSIIDLTIKENYIIPDNILISIANYTNNKSFSERGSYGYLNLLNSNFVEYFSNLTNSKFKKNITINFIHDGTSAARGTNIDSSTAVLTLGTSIGVGFYEKNVILKKINLKNFKILKN